MTTLSPWFPLDCRPSAPASFVSAVNADRVLNPCCGSFQSNSPYILQHFLLRAVLLVAGECGTHIPLPHTAVSPLASLVILYFLSALWKVPFQAPRRREAQFNMFLTAPACEIFNKIYRVGEDRYCQVRVFFASQGSEILSSLADS